MKGRNPSLIRAGFHSIEMADKVYREAKNASQSLVNQGRFPQFKAYTRKKGPVFHVAIPR